MNCFAFGGHPKMQKEKGLEGAGNYPNNILYVLNVQLHL